MLTRSRKWLFMAEIVAQGSRLAESWPPLVWSFLLALAALSDWRRRQIPDWLTLGGSAAALLAAGWQGRPALGAALFGGLTALLLFGPMYVLGRGWRGSGQPALGLGDLKLAVLVGLACRWPAALTALLVGILAGGLAALALLAWHLAHGSYHRHLALPYGSFLALGGLVGLWATTVQHLL